MCCEQHHSLIEDLNPTFLFTCQGRRICDEKNYHQHDFMELAFILSGTEKYHINDQIYNVTEGDLLLINPGVRHEAICSDVSHPATEFFVGFSDFQFAGLPKNHFPLPEGSYLMHTKGELRQKLFKKRYGVSPSQIKKAT